MGRDPGKGIVGDEEVAVDIHEIGELGQMRCGADLDAGFHQTTDHRLQSGLAGSGQGFPGHADAAGFHQFHVHTVKTFGAPGNVLHGVAVFVAEDGQGRAFLQPVKIVHGGLARERLLHELDPAVGGQPFDLAQRLFLGFPAFVGIHA